MAVKGQLKVSVNFQTVAASCTMLQVQYVGIRGVYLQDMAETEQNGQATVGFPMGFEWEGAICNIATR